MTGWEERLSAARPALERAGTAELVASILRENIIEGSLPPGIRLSEEAIGQVLKVSRNTLREAFRLLSHENLLVHKLHRGMFVRRLTASDVADIYRMRRGPAGAAVLPRQSRGTTPHRLRRALLPLTRCCEKNRPA